MAKEKTLSDAFYEALKDTLSAEKASVRAMKKAAKGADGPDLKKALDQHAEESEGQVERLQQVFEIFGKAARGKTCEAMQGLAAELEDHLDDFKGSPAADAVIIGSIQAMEHYEMARYGTLKTWAGQLGLEDAAKLIDQTLQEEKKIDALLSQIAERQANAEAKQAQG